MFELYLNSLGCMAAFALKAVITFTQKEKKNYTPKQHLRGKNILLFTDMEGLESKRFNFSKMQYVVSLQNNNNNKYLTYIAQLSI